MAAKPRAAGFVRGDFDPAFPLDDKVQALRATTDPLHYHAAISVYWHVVAAAWRRPERIPASRTCPEAPDQVADLVRVGLLDRSGRLPLASFNGWIGRAIASRAASTDRKRRQRGSSPERMSRGTDAGHSVTARGTREGEEGVLSVVTTNEEEPTTKGGPGGNEPDDGRVDIEAFLAVRFRAPTPAQRQFMDAYVQVFDVSGPQRAADLILRNPQDPIGALKTDLAEFRKQRVSEATAVERPAPQRKRKRSSFTGVNAELQAFFASRYEEDERKYQHTIGAHASAADERCPECKRGNAA